MTSFNVLDRQQQVHRHALLEASAGTGKTFAIENVVVRLLIEHQPDQLPIPLEKILIVTFTKASAWDLKKRIRANIGKALVFAKEFLSHGAISAMCPDYLTAHFEKGPQSAERARRWLEQALFSFDQAQIFTIHGFCWRMLKNYALEGNVSLEARSREDQPLLSTKLLQSIKDFIRTELSSDIYSPAQLGILLKRVNHQIDKLQDELLTIIQRGIDVQAPPKFSELLLRFQEAMRSLKTIHGFTSEKMLADFITQAPRYKNLCDRSKNIKSEMMKQAQRFTDLFDKEQWGSEDLDHLVIDGLFLCEALDPNNLQKKEKSGPLMLQYPQLWSLLKQGLGEIVHLARDSTVLMARLASDCQKFLQRYQMEEELFGHNDLLVQMKEAIASSHFANLVRQTYEAAVVDEFQDTDPIQWEIFDSLFASPKACWKGHLFLVGDPKQSIYAFRQADIYTYLAAADRLGKGALATLDTNFRSQPELIEALNILFSSVEGLFPLPKKSGVLPYRLVKAGRNSRKQFADHSACLQFWVAHVAEQKACKIKSLETQFFFAAIANELLRLNKEDAIGFGKCAILVSDRHQANRLSKYLKRCHIPVKNQRGENLADLPAVSFMRELLNGILHYRERGSLKVALAGPVIGMTNAEILALNDEDQLSRIAQRCEMLRRTLIDKGFGIFFSEFMASTWHKDGLSVEENLLRREGGSEFYRQWLDIADLLIQEQSAACCSTEGLLSFLDELNQLSQHEEENLGYVDLNEDGVSILTTHISKGLEFDVVFTLSLIHAKEQQGKHLVLMDDGERQFFGSGRSE